MSHPGAADVIFDEFPAGDGIRFRMIQIAENHGYPAFLPSPRPRTRPWGIAPCHAPARVPARGNGLAGPYLHRTAPSRPRPATGRRSRVHSAPHRLRAAGLVAALAFATVAAPRAETLFVTDRIDVGLHRSSDLGSAIVAVVPSDTALEVLGREGALIHVKTPGGASGWIAATYVTEDRPARAVLFEVERRAGARTRELARARETIGDLERRLAGSEERHRAARDTIAILEAEIEVQRSGAAAPIEAGGGRGETRPGTPIPDGTRRELQRLAEENDRLRCTVAELRVELEAQRRTPRKPAGAWPPAAPAAPAAQSAGTPQAVPPVPPAVAQPPPAWQLRHWMLAGFTALLLLCAGGYVVDWRFRRRHGGFRL